MKNRASLGVSGAGPRSALIVRSLVSKLFWTVARFPGNGPGFPCHTVATRHLLVTLGSTVRLGR